MRSFRLLSFALLLVSIPAAASVNLILSATAPVVADPGAAVDLSIYVYNEGTEDAHATATVPLPLSVELISAAGEGWSCTRNASGNVVCTGTVVPLTPSPFVLTVKLPATLDGFRFQGTATISSSVPDTVPENNSSIFVLRSYRILQVTTNADGGAGSLRTAIETANRDCHHAFTCKVLFTEAMTIAPQTPLPPITSCGLIVDAETFVDTPSTFHTWFELPRRVEIDGKNLRAGNGLEVRGDCDETTHLLGLAVNDFPQNGLVLASSGPAPASANIILDGFFIGTDATGKQARPNGWRGISLEEHWLGCKIRRSVISGNARSGIANWSAIGLQVDFTTVGLSAAGELLPNGGSGIFTNAGLLSVEQSTIAGNRQFGIAVGGGAEHVAVFDVFLNGNGGIGLDWGMDGPSTFGGPANMPGVPRITDAFYDPASGQTIVRGVVRVDEKGPYAVEPYVSGPGAPGYGGDGSTHTLAFVPAVPSAQDTQFEVAVRGDLRGRVVTALTRRYSFLDAPPLDCSELSAGIQVR